MDISFLRDAPDDLLRRIAGRALEEAGLAEVEFLACYGMSEADLGGVEEETRVGLAAVEAVAEDRGVEAERVGGMHT